VSQVEAGVLKLVIDKDDPTITVVMDCECENTVGFPLERLKSRIRLLQDHYPCRLASLLVVNLPPEMRGFAQEVLQVRYLNFYLPKAFRVFFFKSNYFKSGVSIRMRRI
jgi:hypothetical protein